MATGDAIDEYKLHDLIAIFGRWRGLAIGAFFAVFIPGVLVTLLMPPLYEASAKMLVDRSMMAPAFSVKVSPSMDSQSLLRTVSNDEEIKTVAETLKTRKAIERTIDKLHLTRERLKTIRDFRRYVQMAIDAVIDGAAWAYDETKYALRLSRRPTAEETAFLRREQLIDGVASRIAVTSLPSTNILNAAFRASDPFLAQEIINSLVTDFLRNEPRTDQSSGDFFAGERTQAAEELRDAALALSKYRQQTSAFSIETQRNLLLQTVERLRGDLTKAEALQAEKQAAVASLTKQRAESPQFQRELSKSLIDAEVELAGNAASIRILRDGINSRMAELAKLADAEAPIKDLELQVSRAEAAYSLQQRNFEQARATERMAAVHLSDVRLVDLASFPLHPVRPRTLLYLCLALGAGVLAALAGPFLAHMNDTTIATERDILRLLDISFVATVPKLTAGTRRAPQLAVGFGDEH